MFTKVIPNPPQLKVPYLLTALSTPFFQAISVVVPLCM